MKARIPGLLLCAALAFAGTVGAPYVPGFGSVALTLVLGLIVGNLGGADGRFAPGVRWVEKRLFAVLVAMLGFGLDLRAVGGLGLVALPSVVVALGATLALAGPLGKALGLTPALSLAVGAGQAICGTAAIAAAGPVVGADEEETGVAVGVIHALGTAGLFLLPPVALAMGLSPDGAGLLLGGTLQSVGHAVAAGFGVSEAVGSATTLVKLGRVATLPVVLLVLGALRGGARGGSRVPPEVVGFVVAAGLRTAGVLPGWAVTGLDVATDVVLGLAMAAIGTRVRLSALVGAGPAALALGAVLFAVQTGVVALAAWWVG